jgi:hypothetical protein
VEYLEWNDLIAGHFFKPSMAGRRVHLFVPKELITKLGAARGAGFDEFIQSVKAGPSWSRATSGLCQKALECLHGWRARGLDYPPYVSYLALFVSAAALEADFAPHAYYPRLRTLLGQEPVTGQLPSFTSMVELWDDLERWSEEDRRGELGRFHHDFFGQWMHCGLPMAQALLSDDERRGLATVFAEAGLEPDAPPPTEELAIALDRHGHSLLRRRTLEMLERSGSAGTELRDALLEAVIAELREWDGTLGKSGDSQREENGDGGFSYGALRLCCVLDRTAACARTYLRCRTRGEFPEDGLQLETEGAPGRLLAEEWGAGWSAAITDEHGKELDAAQFDWSRPLMLEDAAQAWRLRMLASPVRILVAGEREGLPDLVEVRRLPEGTPFTLALRDDFVQAVSAWATSACERWQEVRLKGGLPQGWHLFGADRAHARTGAAAPLALLSLPAKTGLSLRGGIRVSPHSGRYFYFAPPEIELEGAAADTALYCAGQALKPTSDGRYAVPAGLLEAADDGKISLEARTAGEVVAKVSFSIARGSVAWSSAAPRGVSETPSGQPGRHMSTVTGAAVSGLAVPEFCFDGVVPLLAKGSVRYVGREPGQIAASLEERASDWAPVWVVQTRRKGAAQFCGTAIETAAPVLAPCGNSRKLREWKELLWNRRRDIAPPGHARLRELWLQYQEAARLV